MTPAEFEQEVERHRTGLVRFARHLFPGARVAPADIVHDALERVIAKGAYLKYQAEPEAVKAPAWLRRAVELTGLALVKRAGRRARLRSQTAQERVALDDLTVAAQGGDWQAGEPATYELGTSARRTYLDELIAAEEGDERQELVDAALAELPAEVAQGLLLVYGEDLTWAEAAVKVGYEGTVAAFKRRGLRAMDRLTTAFRPAR